MEGKIEGKTTFYKLLAPRGMDSFILFARDIKRAGSL